LVRSMGAPASADSGAWGVALPHTLTHTRAHTLTQTEMQPTAVCQSLSHRRRGARTQRRTHTHTRARRRRWRTACVQSVHAKRCPCASRRARVCVRGSARVQRLRTRAHVCAPAGCVPTLAGMQTSEPLHGFFPPPFLSPCGAFRFSAGLALARLAATCGTIEPPA
jgi:hypothetical protein